MNTKGVLIFAHNSRELDYIRLALISGKLAKTRLKVSVSLITDEVTIKWSKESNIYSKLEDIFDHIIVSDRPNMANQRNLRDGDETQRIPFINSNRSLAWDLTPYNRTLVIDSDFLILSDDLSRYWDIDEDFMIADSAKDLYYTDRLGYHDKYISDTGIKLNWATTFVFTKNKNTKIFFDFCKFIYENYQYYADLFRFDGRQYRNDIAFSIALHVLNGFSSKGSKFLPTIKTILDTDILIDVTNEGLIFVLKDQLGQNQTACRVSNQDIHVMNKQNLLRLENKLLII